MKDTNNYLKTSNENFPLIVYLNRFIIKKEGVNIFPTQYHNKNKVKNQLRAFDTKKLIKFLNNLKSKIIKFNELHRIYGCIIKFQCIPI